MQNNSNDNTQSWKQRLDEFEDISGNNLDLNIAWEKLQQKKDTVKTSTSKKWYWLAAACAVILVATIGLFTNRPSGQIHTGIVKAAQPEAGQEHNSMIILNEPATGTREQAQPEEKLKIENKPGKILRTTGDARPEPLLVKEDIGDIPLSLQIPDTVAVQPLPVMAVAKKLKVVHINELNQPQPGIAKEEGKPYFPITYQTKEIYTTADDNNKKGRDNLIRIKLN